MTITETDPAAVDAAEEEEPQLPGAPQATPLIGLVAIEEEDTIGGGNVGDKRIFPPEAFSWRTPPLTFHVLTTIPGWGHGEADVAGHVSRIKRVPVGDPALTQLFGELHGVNAVVAVGRFDTGEVGTDAARMVGERTLSCLSCDPGGEINVEERCTQTMEDEYGEFCVNYEVRFTHYQIAGFTVLDVGGIDQTTVRIASDADLALFEQLNDLGPGQGAEPMLDDPDLEADEELAAAAWAPLVTPVQPLTAAAGTASPPGRYFEKPAALAGAGFRRLRVAEPDADGWRHVFGYVAPAEGTGHCHIGYPGECKEAKPSPTEYRAGFRTGYVLTAEGDELETGVITMGVGHAPMRRMGRRLSANEAKAHYDNNALVVAYVMCGDDENGWWVSGVAKPSITDAEVMAVRGGALSGDWRGLGGHAEGIAALVVNHPGFPPDSEEGAMAAAADAQTLVEDGHLVAAVGLGRVTGGCGCGGHARAGTDRQLLARLENVERETKRQKALNADREIEALKSGLQRPDPDQAARLLGAGMRRPDRA